MKRPFDKPPISHAEQVGLLAARGMQIADIGQAEFYLKHLNYYRLAAYWLPFEADHETHRFREGTTFEAVLEDVARSDAPAGVLGRTRIDAPGQVPVSLLTGLFRVHQLGARTSLFGLLGTLLGMIKTFWLFNQGGNYATPVVLAGGMWEALLTAAAGLAVAIPAHLARHFLTGRVRALVQDMEWAGSELMRFLLRDYRNGADAQK